ncbi:Cro/CI family transcriptional regulator [Erwinia amylovora]|uniref:Cro/CI family transcriptional regulator n=1 Tax=Erwinia amylovora TaxID=552 RepID=UPI0014439881|nr:Cro/CI family transcriptional regulator [Erwinia amylovora]
MYTRDALKFFGSKSKLAAAAGVKLPSIYKWGNLVPEGRAMRLQTASNNSLVYDPHFYDNPAKSRRDGELNHENQSSD